MCYRRWRGCIWVVALIAFSQTQKLKSLRPWINCSYCKTETKKNFLRIFSLYLSPITKLRDPIAIFCCLPWHEDFCSNLSIIFRSTRLSSTAKTWNCDSVPIPICKVSSFLLFFVLLYIKDSLCSFISGNVENCQWDQERWQRGEQENKTKIGSSFELRTKQV